MRNLTLFLLLLITPWFFAAGVEPTGSPREVSTLDHLVWISTNSSSWGDDFIQTDNIDANSSSSLFGGAGFIPIGTASNPFTGIYDGNGFVIEGLTIDRGSANNVGLFGYILGSSASVTDLALYNVNITGQNNVGGFVGQLSSSSTLTNCSSAGSVNGNSYTGGLVGMVTGSCTITNSYSSVAVTSSGTDSYFGGLIGYSSSSTISGCYATGIVQGGGSSDIIGGLIGHSTSSTISDCYSTGETQGGAGGDKIGGLIGYSTSNVEKCYSTSNVSGQSYIGGLIGYTEVSVRTISESYSTGEVTGKEYCGGLIGYNNESTIINCYSNGRVVRKGASTSTMFGAFIASNSNATIENCYSISSIEYIGASNPTDKGFVGASTSGTYTNNFWDSETSNQTTATGATSKSVPEMKIQTTYMLNNWDFRGEQHNGTDDIWALEPDASFNNGYPYFAREYAGVSSPMITGASYEVFNLQDLMWLSQHPYLAGRFGIQLFSDIDASETASWSGGAGFTPIGNSSEKFNCDFFGNGYSITGLTINQSFNNNVGLIGVFGRNGYVGHFSLVDVSIIGNNYVGGLVGKLEDAYGLRMCKVTGNVTGNNYTGLLVGYSNSPISNCYGKGTVNRASGSSSTYFGCFVGYNRSTIENSYAVGSVEYLGTTNATDKGFVGYNTSAGTFSNNFWDSEASNQTTATGATGKTTAEMKNLATFTDETTTGLTTAWDFETNPNDDVANSDIWDIDLDGVFNNGYPFLSWENGSGVAVPVELINFTSSVSSSTVVLNWTTATEVNNYGFDVERQILNQAQNDIPKWEAIGFVEGHGNSNSLKEYSFVDSDIPVAEQTRSYRLKQIDIDGTFKYSEVVTVELTSSMEYKLTQNHPNPFNPSTQISFSMPEAGVVKLNIYNVLGEVVSELVNENLEAGFHQYQFNANNLTSGIYFYSISVNGFTQLKKMNLIK